MDPIKLYELFIQCGGISTDTRKIAKDVLFFALKGDKFDANEFAAEALGKGAKYVVMDNPKFYDPQNPKMILVDDTLVALQQLANQYRKTLTIPVIAVCGSNGKTTTKELTKAVLSQKFITFATQGNLNNHIGVPLSLLSIPRNTEIAVIEMGANHEGETKLLCEIAQPDFGLITNNGLDHLEGFGSIEGVKRANGELFDYLLENNGKAFVNALETDLLEMSEKLPQKFFYGNHNQPHHFYFAKELAEGMDAKMGVKFKTEKNEMVETQLFGSYNFYNILTALCIGKYFKVPSELANQAIANYIPANNRSQIIEKNTNTIILDAYNANPSSVGKALESFVKTKNEKKVLILGDMLELGDYSIEEHRKLGKLLSEYQFDTLIFFGKEIQEALPFNPKAYYFSDKFSLHNWLADKKIQNALWLIKGSRGMGLESVLDFI